MEEAIKQSDVIIIAIPSAYIQAKYCYPSQNIFEGAPYLSKGILPEVVRIVE
jgi:glycerol-3-phosphate dehydrogenase